MRPLAASVLLVLMTLSVQPVAGQSADSLPRRMAGPDCDSSAVAADSVYEFDAVDRQVVARRLDIRDLPFRAREVISGSATFRFIVAASGRVEPCSIELVAETTPAWTAAVYRELRRARYQPARLAGKAVRQRVHQEFTYHQDGRLLHGR